MIWRSATMKTLLRWSFRLLKTLEGANFVLIHPQGFLVDDAEKTMCSWDFGNKSRWGTETCVSFHPTTSQRDYLNQRRLITPKGCSSKANDWFSVHQNPAFLPLHYIVPSKKKLFWGSVCVPLTHLTVLQLSGQNAFLARGEGHVQDLFPPQSRGLGFSQLWMVMTALAVKPWGV